MKMQCIFHRWKALIRFKIGMNKMVNGQEEEMGVLTFNYDVKQKKLTSVDSIHDTRWTLILKENKLEGTLKYKNNIYRVINVIKEK